MNDVDVVVVGLGPGGEAVATQLAQAGLDVVAVDRRLVGGECPYYACVPTKIMVRGSDVLAEGRRVPRVAGARSVAPEWGAVHGRVRGGGTRAWGEEGAVGRVEEGGGRGARGAGGVAWARAGGG